MAANNYDNQASTNYKEAFSLFDKRGNGRVTLDSLGDLLRACGQNPTLSEIRDLEKNVGGDCKFGACGSPFLPLLFSWLCLSVHDARRLRSAFRLAASQPKGQARASYR